MCKAREKPINLFNCFSFSRQMNMIFISKTCQNNISRCPGNGGCDTFLTLENRRGICRAFLAAVLQRFFVVFCRFRILLIFSIIRCFLVLCCVSRLSKTVQNACKIVNLDLSSSQFRSTTKSILQLHFDYFRVQNTQNDAVKGTKRHRKPYFLHLKT